MMGVCPAGGEVTGMGHGDASATGTTLLVLLRDPTDHRAWEGFVLRYRPKLLAWIRGWGLQDSDADDLSQEVLTKLLVKIRGFVYDPAKGAFRGWLRTVARNALRDAVAARPRPGGVGGSAMTDLLESAAACDDFADSLEKEYEHELFVAAAERVKGEVSARDWTIFMGLLTKEKAGKELAQELGMQQAAVYVAKKRVQDRLAAAVRELERRGGSD
jgi:RNA polymerase sigma-70 factor (ECF subfamily)